MSFILAAGQAVSPLNPTEEHKLLVELEHIELCLIQKQQQRDNEWCDEDNFEGKNVYSQAALKGTREFCARHKLDLACAGVALFLYIPLLVMLKLPYWLGILITLLVFIPLYLGAINRGYSRTRPAIWFGLLRILLLAASITIFAYTIQELAPHNCLYETCGVPSRPAPHVISYVDASRLEIRLFRVGIIFLMSFHQTTSRPVLLSSFLSPAWMA